MMLFNFAENHNGQIKDIHDVKLSIADKWILTELDNLIASIDRKFDKYDIGMCASELYDFFWTKFCDWYIEFSKVSLNSNNQEDKDGAVATLLYVLKALMKMLHPFIPFITEEIYLSLPEHDESIVISEWVKQDKTLVFEKEAKFVSQIMEIIRSIRNERKNKAVPDKQKIELFAIPVIDSEELRESGAYIQKLTNASLMSFITSNDEIPSNSTQLVFENVKIFFNVNEQIDNKAELEKLNRDLKNIEKEIARAEGLLANVGFVAKAPKQLVDTEKEKLKSNKEFRENLLKTIEQFKK